MCTSYVLRGTVKLFSKIVPIYKSTDHVAAHFLMTSVRWSFIKVLIFADLVGKLMDPFSFKFHFPFMKKIKHLFMYFL